VIKAKDLAYFALDQKTYPSLGPAHNFGHADKRVAFLWGDPVYVIKLENGVATVSGKGHHVEIQVKHLMEDPILCIYQIDCGQGDAALIHFPDDRWIMVDAGPNHDWSNSGKIAPDFLYWKMFVDQSWKNEFNFRKAPFVFDALICTHPDYDHYGGFLDMTKHVKLKTLQYNNVYHGGLGRFDGKTESYDGKKGHGQLGPVRGNALPDAYMTALIDGFSDILKYSKTSGTRNWKLKGSYADWLQELQSLQGQGVGNIKRIDSSIGHLPGYEPGNSDVVVNVLGPIVEKWQNKPAMRYLDSGSRIGDPSLTRNGHSVVLRLDYKKARILLTGDLNFRSQALLLKHAASSEFSCHVAKACHHGAEDISWKFLEAMSPMATMFSSGDNESYAHPRARALGLSGAFGQKSSLLTKSGKVKKLSFLDLEEDQLIAPLIYSTEISRSIELHPPHAAFDAAGKRIAKAEIQAQGRTKPNNGRREKLKDWLLADKLVYGLINVRTDGSTILLAVSNEGKPGFQLEKLSIQ
jgi:hypothetical protein